VRRPVAASIDGVLMVLGAVWVVFLADASFSTQFQGFLITLGVPVAAWCGIFLGDLLLRRRDYAEADLYDPRGRYGAAQPVPLLLLALGTALGWGLVTNTYANWLTWQGYLLGPVGLGGKDGSWAFANLGVLVALAVGFLGTVLLRRGAVRRQEAA
jgi:NCS1 family nucleobase:cation symporter-1